MSKRHNTSPKGTSLFISSSGKTERVQELKLVAALL